MFSVLPRNLLAVPCLSKGAGGEGAAEGDFTPIGQASHTRRQCAENGDSLCTVRALSGYFCKQLFAEVVFNQKSYPHFM